jgi:hypothetical protein
VTAGIVENPAAYRWSGHRELLGRTRRTLIDRDAVLSSFGGTRREAVGAYMAMLQQEGRQEWIGARLALLLWWSAAPEPEKIARGVDALGRSSGPERRRMSTERFLERLAPLLGVSVVELAGGSRVPHLVEARELVGTLAVERWGIGVKTLAEALGKSRDGVSHWVRRGAAKRSESGAFAGRLEDLDQRLAAMLEGIRREP